MEDKYLEHYGILGMKWGIRRTPEQLGHHKIKKGTTMYRVTPNKNEVASGKTYVTYLPPDRDFYRGTYLSGIRKQYGLSDKTKMYESTYTTSEKLNIPSRKVLNKAYEEVMKSDDLRINALTKYANKLAEQTTAQYEGLADVKLNKDERLQMAKNTVDSVLRGWETTGLRKDRFSLEWRFMTAVRAGNMTSPEIQYAVIDLLKKQGYNAMIDEGGVGNNLGREGYAPLIVFDGNKSLTKTGATIIDKKINEDATNKNKEWKEVANKFARKNTPW